MPGSARLALATGLAYATHTLLDWLGTDASPPIGIMALWPFSRIAISNRHGTSSWRSPGVIGCPSSGRTTSARWDASC